MKEFFMKFGLKDFEADYILSQIENKEEFTINELKENTISLLKYVNIENLSQIFLLLPNILFHDNEYLENQLADIKKKYDDVENYLLFGENVTI